MTVQLTSEPKCDRCQTPMERYAVPGTGGKEQAWRLACPCQHSTTPDVARASKKVSLLSCPFCGSNRVQVVRSFIDSDSNIVHCPHCDACGPRALSTEPEGTAEARWNASRATHETGAVSAKQVERTREFYLGYLSDELHAHAPHLFDLMRRKDPQAIADTLNKMNAPKANSCVCGEPNSPGTHRTDGPCLAPIGDHHP